MTTQVSSRKRTGQSPKLNRTSISGSGSLNLSGRWIFPLARPKGRRSSGVRVSGLISAKDEALPLFYPSGIFGEMGLGFIDINHGRLHDYKYSRVYGFSVKKDSGIDDR